MNQTVHRTLKLCTGPSGVTPDASEKDSETMLKLWSVIVDHDNFGYPTMNNSAQHHCKVVSDQQWSLSTFTEFYERVLGSRLYKPYGELLVNEIRKDIDTRTPPTRILEVACGTGRITTAIYEGLAKPLNIQLTATDLSKIAIDMAQRVVSDEMRRDVTFMADVDMADMPFADNSFDIIVCGFGLMFPPDKVRIAREFKRVLRSGGKIYGTVFHYNELFDLARSESQKYFCIPSAIMDAALSLSDHSPITRAFSLEGLCQNTDESVTLYPMSFQLSDDDTREFLFNACILLEEFNQCDSVMREQYLDTMLRAFNAQVPDRHYQVEAWLIRGQVDKTDNTSVKKAPGPEFAALAAFYQLTPEAFRKRKTLPPLLQNSQPLQQYLAMKQAFLSEYPTYPEAKVEALRARNFSRMESRKVTYLDHVGGTLAPLCLIEGNYQMLRNTILGNPHSGSRTSEEIYEQARQAIYHFFNCSPDEYEIIFTANASSAIRLVAESFPYENGTEVLLTKDNHTSVHSIREYAKSKGAQVKYIPLDQALQIPDSSMRRALDNLSPRHTHLLAYPAQSNATGIRHSLKWVNAAQEKGAMVLLDAAAFVPQSRLDYSQHQPDFMTISFYKMFGYPTGAGCLIARRSLLGKLVPHSFAGGAVCYYSGPWSPTERLLYRDDGRRFEIGTPNYASFHAIALGFQFLSELGLEEVERRSSALARWLELKLSELRHSTKLGTPLCQVYGLSVKNKGATVMLNFFDCNNAIFSHALIRQALENVGIIVRNGCFCNLGTVQQATYTTAGAEHCELDKYEKILDCKTFDDKILSKGHCGAIRVSLGLGSNFSDVYCFYLFAKGLLNTEAESFEVAMSSSTFPAFISTSLE
ncbi:aminotransferase class V-fold PLP-dependent enzyme [Pectobacterium aroidearum]|uniref:aminotransferase class V-fold PLP-dependent enzyme n=1 Tax=Pectobacterium aroidearum TaxID=1201031 RepID=UPI0015F0D2DB|nr:aminotransferase class V-fold PLP-dependent enzyme [Pectobacterium aroidearum]MBA5235383.1 aminotransferase class V-fold PLP-dependent enzyme [Pectobacterium aroidearum]